MYLLSEHSNQIELRTENTKQERQLYIEGIFAQAEVKNGNGRIYERHIMESALDTYINEYVSKKRALGELNHPSRPFADPEHAAILIESLTWDGNNVVGRAKVLPTPKGKIVKGLLEGGFNMGVSTRALGTMTERNGAQYVNNDLMFTAVDCVDNPSGPNCYVDPLMESVQWINENGIWVPQNKVTQEPIDEELLMAQVRAFVFGKKL